MPDPAGIWGWISSQANSFFYVSRFSITLGTLFLFLTLIGTIHIPVVFDVRLILFGFAVELWKYSDWDEWQQKSFSILLFALTFVPMKYLQIIYNYFIS